MYAGMTVVSCNLRRERCDLPLSKHDRKRVYLMDQKASSGIAIDALIKNRTTRLTEATFRWQRNEGLGDESFHFYKRRRLKAPSVTKPRSRSTHRCKSSFQMARRVQPRQRQRKLPVMTNSERGKYYRRLNKEMEIQREKRIRFLHREVDRLQIQLQIARCLDRLLLPLSLSDVSNFLSHFITERLDTSPSTLQKSQVDVRSVTIVGATEAPIIRLECVLRGQLHPQLVRHLYQFMVGNSFAFEKMMHEEAEYTCTCFFYFSTDGRIERFAIERGVVSIIREYLGDLPALGLTLRVHGDLEPFGN